MSISWPTYYCPAKNICTATFGTIAALKMHAAKVGHVMDKSALQDAINNPKKPGGFLPGLSEPEHIKTDHTNSESAGSSSSCVLSVRITDSSQVPADPLDVNAPDSEFPASPFEAGPWSPDVPLQQLESSAPPVVQKGVHPHGDQGVSTRTMATPLMLIARLTPITPTKTNSRTTSILLAVTRTLMIAGR